MARGRLNLLTGHTQMPRKLAVGLMQSLAIRESPRDMSKLFGKVTEKEELELWTSSCTCICGKLFHDV